MISRPVLATTRQPASVVRLRDEMRRRGLTSWTVTMFMRPPGQT